MWINNAEFTRFGKELQDGKYDKLEVDSIEYLELWQEQIHRCYNGFEVSGRYMSGMMYMYLNFGTVGVYDEDNKILKPSRPNLRDIEWEVFKYLEICKEEGKNFLWISGRRAAKTMINSWCLAYYYTLFSNTLGIAGAHNSKYTDTVMSAVDMHLSGFIDTPFFLPSTKYSIKDGIISGWEEKTEKTGSYVKSKNVHISKILPFTFHENAQAASGKAIKWAALDEVGKFDNLIEVYGALDPALKSGGTRFGHIFLSGTGGDMSSKGSIGAKKMFYEPESYDLLAFEDNETKKKTAFFLSAEYILPDYKDESGNTYVEAAHQYLQEEREKRETSQDKQNLLSFIQFYPFTPEEAFLASEGNIFPTMELQRQIEKIYHDKRYRIGETGRLEKTETGVEFYMDDKLREAPYPINRNEIEGCITIYEHPYVDEETGKIPPLLYMGGCDPYAHDTAETSDSLGSCFIYKRFLPGSGKGDFVVAEYTGRPATTKEFYENVLRLARYYNAQILYENNVVGMYDYFRDKHYEYLLADKPGIVDQIVDDTKVKRSKGINRSSKVKEYTLQLTRDWLLDEYAENMTNVTSILSVNLLKELLNYNSEGNFDRVDAFGYTLMLVNEYKRVELKVARERNNPWGALLSNLVQH